MYNCRGPEMKQSKLFDISRLAGPILEALGEFGQGLALIQAKSKEIVYVNEALCRISGFSSMELLAFPSFTNLLNSYPPDIFSDVPALKTIRATVSPIDVILLHKSGNRLHAELAAYRLPFTKDNDYLVFLVRDITRRKQSEDQVQLFQTIGLAVNEAPDFSSALGMVLRKVCIATGWEYGEAWVPDEDQSQLHFNAIWYGADVQMDNLRKVRQNLFFHKGEGLPGRAWRDQHPQWVEDVESDNDAMSKMMKWEFGLQSGMAIPAVTQDRVVAILIFYVSKRHSNRELFRDLSSIITPQIGTLFLKKSAEERLKETNIFLDSIIENIPDMVFIKDAKDLKFVRFNKAGEDLLGISRDKMIGKTDYDLFPKEEADFFTKKDRSVLEQGKLVEIKEERIHTRNGVRVLHTKKIPIWNENRKPLYLLGISEDITDQIKKQS